ncbi:MAG: hypothetical protein ACK50L_04870 [Bacteroidota bacterium]
MNKRSIILAATLAAALFVNARETEGLAFRKSSVSKVLAGCTPAQSSAELAVNNVRTIIYSGSDMWWDLFGGGGAYYVIPKVQERAKWVNSTFAGNVWFGGLDVGGQLKVAAQTYRQGGVDFWTGPLSTIDASITSDICKKYDKLFKITRKEVDNFVLSGGAITPNIRDWPGNGDLALNQDPYLAPWVDKFGVAGGDGVYEPEQGDYPYYDVNNNAGKDNLGVCKARVFGDETLWWVYNDKGDIHQATQSPAIGLEVRAQAFAFKTTDDINNATFYNYQIINRSSFKLTKTYMTVFVDADLGQYMDDYIGCDVKRGLGYIYNGDAIDQTEFGVNGYGDYIPAFGCDFFQGPINTTNGIDDNNNGSIDEAGEQMGMSKFFYFNNSTAGFAQQTTDPSNFVQYYNYMSGFWRDGTPFTCDVANGYGGAVQTSYIFPGDTYSNSPCGSTPWEESAVPGDRRFLQSSGPFDLEAGAVNFVTYGMPWAKATAPNSPKSALPLLKTADDKAQALFDNCFKVLSGPEAPDITIQELENELILYMSNKPSSNNYLNSYKELDPTILVDTITTVTSGTTTTTRFKNVDRYYRFEGYKIYQLKNDGVTQEDLNDLSKAKLIFSCDLNNGVKRLVNYEYDAESAGDKAIVKADGTDNGISTTFRFTKDEFSQSSDKKVINNKTYYFIAVAYGYNNWVTYKEDVIWTGLNSPCLEGQKKPYLEGRKSKKAYGIPHNPENEKFGTQGNSFYGYGPKITRYEGYGNGGNILDFTQETLDRVVNNEGRTDVLTYENGKGPINIRVVDPLSVPNSSFTIQFIKKNYYSNEATATANACVYDINKKVTSRSAAFGSILGDSVTWVLKDVTNNKEYVPCKSIKLGEEFYFSEIGLSVKITQVADVASLSFPANSVTDNIVGASSFLGASMTFSDPEKIWLTGVRDVDGTSGSNWIRAGSFAAANTAATNQNQNDYNFPDPLHLPNGKLFNDPGQVFEGVLAGTWAPYCLVAPYKTQSGANAATSGAPGYGSMYVGSGDLNSAYNLSNLSSVDVVLTKDKSKWTRAMVIEECDEQAANPTNARKFDLRRSRSVDKQGIPTGSAGCNESEALLDTFTYGCGWFPGYAVNLETGERLNIAFGEDSYQQANNGSDMLWNPPTSFSSSLASYQSQFGGRHYIYVFGHSRSNSRYTASATGLSGKLIGSGTYADYKDLVYQYKRATAGAGAFVDILMNNIWSDALWVNIPVVTEDRFKFKNPADMPCDVKVRLRVAKSYKKGLAGSVFTNNAGATGALVNAISAPATATNYAQFTADTLTTPANNNFGFYGFTTSDIFTETGNSEVAKKALDLINIVPNPYYAYSQYEKNRLDNVVRITNLPNKCTIKIFSLNGVLVRTFDRDVTGQEDETQITSEYNHSKRLPYQDWDIKNHSGIPVATGLYIVHIDVPNVGEKILKWYGVMRPLDLQSY